MKRFALGLGLAAAVGLAASCIIAYVDTPDYGTEGGLFRFQESVPFKPGGTVSLVNTNGDIRVRGWDEERLEVRAAEPGRSGDARRFRVGGIDSFELDIRLRIDDDAARIQCPDDADRDSVYDFDLRVPRSVKLGAVRNGEGRIVVAGVYGRLEIDAARGEVVVENFSGALDVSLEEGDVLAEVLDIRDEDEIRVEVGEGTIEIFLQEPVGSVLDFEARDGAITSEIALGPALPAPRLEVKPERATGRVVLKTGRGDIRVRKAARTGRGD